MKNKELKKVMAATLAAALLAGNTGSTMLIYAAGRTETASAEEAVKPIKNETVYVKTDASGNISEITVSDQLKNVKGISEISDISDLTDIENVKGEESLKKTGNKLVWQTKDSSEICYQGGTERQLPLGVSILYELDGKQIDAESLKGKSGHLKITYTYQNMTGTAKSYIPFLMITGMVMDTDKVTNITVKNGKLISDGEHDVVIGFGIPGIKDYLELKETALGQEALEIPEGFAVEMDVDDYETGISMTIATNELFNSVSTDDFGSISELKDSMSELQNAAAELVDGSGQLKDGVNTLLTSSAIVKNGITSLAEGGNELSKGTKNLVQGTEALSDGAKSLADGTSRLAEGSGGLVSGSEALAAGIVSAKQGAGSLDAGISQISSGVSGMESQAADGITALEQGAGAVVDGIDQARNGAEQLNAGIDTAAAGAAKLSAGMSPVKEGVLGMKQLASAIFAALPDSVTDPNYEVSLDVDNSGERAAVEAELRSAGVSEELITNVLSEIPDKTVTGTVAVTVDINTDNAAVADCASQLLNYSTQVEAGIGQLETGAKELENTLSEGGTIKSGAIQLCAGLSREGELLNGALQLQEGMNRLGNSLSEGMGTLLAGLGSVKDGSSTLANGLSNLETGANDLSTGNKALDQGISGANDGVRVLAEGSDALLEGAGKLNAGAAALSDGLGTLRNGFGQLSDGIQQLSGGAGELHEGMIQFDEEGIEKLVNIFDGGTEAFLDKINMMLDNSRNYKNFSGISENMDGEVKFIFITE